MGLGGIGVGIPQLKTRLFWRDLVAEFLGTFILVSAQCTLPLTWIPNGFGLGNVVHIGLGMAFVITAIAETFGRFGGGHFNPAVTVGFVVALEMPLIKGCFYIIVQCLGAITGAGFVYGVTPNNSRDSLAATTLGENILPWQGFLVETWITFILVLTIWGSTNTNRTDINVPSLPIGGAVGLGILLGIAYTGGSMNPARSLGPAVVMGIWKHHWIYWVGPICGSLLATFIYHYGLDKVKDKKSEPGDAYDVKGEINGGFNFLDINHAASNTPSNILSIKL